MPTQFRLKGLQPYLSTVDAMLDFTQNRDPSTPDQCWLLEHPPIFTQGPSTESHHMHTASGIPCVNTDRGGKMTYHGPGQLIVYTLINLRARALTPHGLVRCLENTLIRLLNDYDLDAYADPNARGVYVQGAKIAALGLRIKRGSSYHGFALNVDMDLSPFQYINPCGFPHLKITQLSHHVPIQALDFLVTKIIAHLCQQLGYTGPMIVNEIDDDRYATTRSLSKIAWPRKAGAHSD